MKPKTRILSWFVLAVFSLALSTAWSLSQGERASIQVNQASIREKPSMLSKPLGKPLEYCDQVIVWEIREHWLRVEDTRRNKTKGWIPRTSINEKFIILSTKQGSGTVSGSESVNAGRGFNAQVEEAYQKQTNLNYEPVDRAVKQNVTRQQIIDFMNKGRLGHGS